MKNITSKTPIAFIVYNRPDKVKRILDSLVKCYDIDTCKIYAFSDAPRDLNAEKNVKKVRNILRKYSDRLDIEIVERDKNYGCAKNVVEAVNYIFTFSPYVIYLEDDVIVNEQFVRYMKNQLQHYMMDDTVFSINSYNQSKIEKSDADFYRSKRFSSWGTGLYYRSWKNVRFEFDSDNKLNGYAGNDLKKLSNSLIKSVAPDLFTTYIEHKKGFHAWNKNGDDWDIQCLYFMLMHKQVAITPINNYSSNIGIEDGSGIHVRRTGIKRKITNDIRIILAYIHLTGIVQKITNI